MTNAPNYRIVRHVVAGINTIVFGMNGEKKVVKRIRKFYRRQKYKIVKILDRITGGLFREADFRSARQKLLFSTELSGEEKAMLERVSIQVHQNDDMYVTEAGAQPYLSIGLSAIRCINSALEKSGKDKAIRSVLDFPCGHARVLRFLRVRFPAADITASELDPSALDFCGREFSVQTALSDKDFSKVPLSGKFDLIWCGSLITHLDEKATTELLRFFHGLLARDGLLVFTTHGLTADAGIQRGNDGSSTGDQQGSSSPSKRKGYEYVDYKNQHGYGTSIVTKEYMLEIARSVGKWKNTFYQERGWGNFQDVYGFTKEE